MTVGYDCEVNLNDYEDLTQEDLEAVATALKNYEWYHEGGKLVISGECEVDDYAYSAKDVADELKWLLWDAAEIDADVDAEEIEYEPDWDKMPGGYDTL